MPAPGTVPEFLDLVRRSGIVSSEKFDARINEWNRTGTMPNTNEKAANQFIRDGLVTNFQAKQLLQGRWRRFMIGSKYKLLELLGAGGMGAVYLCEHIFMRRLVALKVLPVDKLAEPSMLERFYREARASAALDHPNIVRAYDIDQFDKLHFLVMEYVEGCSMQEMVAKSGPLPIERACHYIAQSANGLQHAHEAGMVHRDIKPGNLLVDKTGAVKILDMGLARFFGNKNDNVTEKYDERSVLGTADYLAPEQALNKPLDIRADIYSLGGTFYFLLTGQLLYPDGNVAQKLVWHQKKDPTPIRQIRKDVPAKIEAIIQKMLAKKAADRFQTPSELVLALTPWISTPIAPPPIQEMPQLCPAVIAISRQNETPGTPVAAGTMGPMPMMPTPVTSRPSTPVRGYPQPDADPVATPTGFDENETFGEDDPSADDIQTPKLPSKGLPIVPIIAGVVAFGVALGSYFAFFAAPKSTGTTPVISPLTKPEPTREEPEPNDNAVMIKVNGKELASDVLLTRAGELVNVEFVVLSKGGMMNVYLNCRADFKDKGNFAAKLTPEAIKELKSKNIEPDDLVGKRIKVRGTIEKTKSNDLETGSTHVTVRTGDEVEILE